MICFHLKKYFQDPDGTKHHEVTMDSEYERYGCMAGSNTSRFTMEELERIRMDKDAFTTLPLYPGRKSYKKVSI